jgi:hypothetical protein
MRALRTASRPFKRAEILFPPNLISARFFSTVPPSSHPLYTCLVASSIPLKLATTFPPLYPCYMARPSHPLGMISPTTHLQTSSRRPRLPHSPEAFCFSPPTATDQLLLQPKFDSRQTGPVERIDCHRSPPSSAEGKSGGALPPLPHSSRQRTPAPKCSALVQLAIPGSGAKTGSPHPPQALVQDCVPAASTPTQPTDGRQATAAACQRTAARLLNRVPGINRQSIHRLPDPPPHRNTRMISPRQLRGIRRSRPRPLLQLALVKNVLTVG